MRNPFIALAARERLWGLEVNDADLVKASPRRMAPDLLRLFLAARIPITLWGPVGARKTRTIEAMAEERDENGVPYQVITLQPSTQDPTVIHGMMYTSQATDGSTVMRRSIPAVAQQVVEYHERTGGYTIIFADEMTTCMPAQQNAMLGILTHGRFEGIDISPFITIAMAANPEGTVSTVNALGEAVLNRGGHIAWYGDVKLFLEEWSSGFGSPSRKPTRQVEWYIRELIGQAPDDAFRNDRWDPAGLVPWDLLEHTERAVTETARIVALICEVFGDADDHLRHHYIVEATRAILGNDWAEKMGFVTGMEADAVLPESVIAAVREARITSSTTFDELQAAVGDSLRRTPGGAELRQDQVEVMADGLLAMVTEESGFSLSAYLAAWAFCVSASTSGGLMGLHARMRELPRLAKAAINDGHLDRANAIPAFVTTEIRAALRGAPPASQAVPAAPVTDAAPLVAAG